MPKEEKSSFSHFFREDAKLVADVLHEEEGQDSTVRTPEIELIKPFIKNGQTVSDDQVRLEWKKLRTFFRQGLADCKLSPDFRPAILAPAYTADLVAQDYPMWLAGNSSALGECLSFNQLLDQAFSRMDLGDGSSILVNSKDRLLHLAKLYLEENGVSTLEKVLPEILNQLSAQLQVKGNEGKAFSDEIKQLKKILPDHGRLISFSNEANFHLFNGALQHTSQQARIDLQREILELKSKLKDLLRVEADKDPAGKDPDKLKDSLGFADSMMKFDALASLVPDEGSIRMDADRLERIAGIIKVLENSELLLDFRASIFIDESLYNGKQLLWHELFEKAEINAWSAKEGLNELGVLFSEQIDPYEQLFSAKRIAELELENKYQPEIHDDYFAGFTWQNFSEEELLQSTYFILIVDDLHLFGPQFSGLSDLLRDNFPIKILAVKRNLSGSDLSDAPARGSLHSQVELGALMLSYRNIFVAQSSSIDPGYLFGQFKEGLSAFAPAFMYVLDLGSKDVRNAYLLASSILECRDFPAFTFRGLLGTPWGSRFEIKHNPQPDVDWPTHRLAVEIDGNEKDFLDVPFTFGDWSSLNHDYGEHFLPVPDFAWTGDLIPLDLYLRLTSQESIGKVPFIWMVDQKSQLHRVAVSWPVTIACRERLDFWHFLQENSGINNYHVDAAVAKAQADLKREHQTELEAIQNEHLEEVEKIKNEEAGKVMENLAAVLLELDTTNMVRTPTMQSVAVPPETVEHEAGKPVERKQDAVEEKVQEDSLMIEPYIDTALCTSCNECINRNKAMFRYNADKMAYIADASAGTFRQLVEAAEVCPVAIIHPGTPLNPHEPDLDQLIKRAAQFN
ncbi:MAG: ferredoxin [Saprospiraceae bacterium]|nr:ferredoxin [Saprospiraceae bacterium]